MYERLYNLAKLKRQNTQPSDINFVVESAYKIALNYLRQKYIRYQNLIINDDLHMEDIAIDSIAPLFLKDESKQFYVLVNAYNNWSPPIHCNEDALFFLNKIVAAQIEQHVTVLLRESDPVFGKILDSVNYLIKKEGYKKINYFGEMYIVKNKCSCIYEKVISAEEFELLPSSLFINKKTIFINLFHVIENKQGYFPAIPINSFVSKLKHIALFDYHNNKNQPKFLFDQIEVEECISLGLTKAQKKLENYYLKKEKLSISEFNTFTKVLSDMAVDLKDGGIKHGLYDYLNVYFPNLTREKYYTKYQDILEYILKIMKKTIAETFCE